MNGVQTRFKCKLDVKRCKRFVFPPSSLLPRSNALKTKAIRYFQTDRTLTRIVSPPLLNNDMWRIYGILFFNDKNHFLNSTLKSFCREQIIDFLNEKGIALFDTASSIRRLQDNASDKFLEVVEATDVAALLRQLPECKAIVTTGQKATDTLRQQFDIEEPKVGDYSEFVFEGRALRLYRMPSSSRAYPLALDKKAAAYRIMFQDLQILK